MMKNRFRMITVFLACLALAAGMLAGASAGTSVEGGSAGAPASSETDFRMRLLNLPDYKFRIHKEGIGYGNCPVYSAPYNDAFRAAGGKAVCDTDAEISEAGYDAGGWLLIRYELSNGGYRVGYIPPNYVKGFKTDMPLPRFDPVPVIAADIISVCDNPGKSGTVFARLDAGEEFGILSKYTYSGDWWYIECTVDGKRARGYIDRNSSSFFDGSDNPCGLVVTGVDSLGTPPVSPMGTEQIGVVTVTSEKRINVRQKADTASRQVTVAYPGIGYPCYGVQTGTNGGDWYYIWVETDSAWGWVYSGLGRLSR